MTRMFPAIYMVKTQKDGHIGSCRSPHRINLGTFMCMSSTLSKSPCISIIMIYDMS